MCIEMYLPSVCVAKIVCVCVCVCVCFLQRQRVYVCCKDRVYVCVFVCERERQGECTIDSFLTNANDYLVGYKSIDKE